MAGFAVSINGWIWVSTEDAINCRCCNGRNRDDSVLRGRTGGWAWLLHAWSGWRTSLIMVKPETVLAWHRQGFRLFWTWKSRRRTGRPPVPRDAAALIRKIAHENPLWGAPRIHGELLKLGVQVSQATVAKYMARPIRPPSQSWRTFLTNHVHQIAAADFFVVPT